MNAMNAATHHVMNRPLPTGHIDARDFPPSTDKMNKILTKTAEELREKLHGFLTQYTDWFYGTLEIDINVWHIGYEWGSRSEGEYIPPNLVISFWKLAPTYLQKGKSLTERELNIPAQFMGKFLTEHPHLGCKTEKVIENPWVITYHIFSKISKPRRR